MTEFEPSRAIGRSFGRIHKLTRSRMRASWQAMGLFRGQNEILFVLWHEEGMTQSELAARTLVAPATITNSLQRMERDGWIARRPDPEDQRISRVYLTEKGRKAQQPVQTAFIGLEQDMLRGFSDEESARLKAYLDRVMQNLVESCREGKEE